MSRGSVDQEEEKPTIALWIIIDVSLEKAAELLAPGSLWHKWHTPEGHKEEAGELYKYLGKHGHEVNAKLKMATDGKEPYYDESKQICLRLGAYSEEGTFVNQGYALEMVEVGRIEAQAEVVRRKEQIDKNPELYSKIVKN